MSFHKTSYKYLVQEKLQPYDKRDIRNYKWNFTEFAEFRQENKIQSQGRGIELAPLQNFLSKIRIY